MTDYPGFGFEAFISQLYADAQLSHGNLDLEVDVYRSRLTSILCKYLGDIPPEVDALNFLRRTHADDLYLTIACAERIEAAWERFVETFSEFIYRLANFVIPNTAAADEMANNIISDLYAPDHSNRPRIGSYDGQSSLARWLRVVITHRAIDEQELKWNSVARLDDLPDLADALGVERLEASERASRYRLIILSTLKEVVGGLTSRERYILLMIYTEALQSKEVARLLNVHPSRVTRQLRLIHKRIRQEVIRILAQRHRLGEDAIKECLTDIVENPEHSLLGFLKAG